MKKRLLIMLAIICVFIANASANDWKSYISYHDVTVNLPIGNRVYCLGSGGLFAYTYGATQVRTFSKSTGLSSTNITHMAYCEDLQQLVLIYEDFNIDILGINDSIVNIPQYKNSSLTDKTIVDLTISGEEAFLSTNFGLVVINLKKAEYTNVYDMGMKIHGAVADEERIYALGPDGIYTGLRSKNLLERTNWVKSSSTYLSKFITFNGGIYGLNGQGISSVNTADFSMKRLASGKFDYFSQYGRDLVAGNANQIIVMDEDEEVTTLNVANDFAYLTSDGTHLWASRRTLGLQSFSIDADTLKPTSGSIIPNSPIRNYFAQLTYTPDNKLLVAGGQLAYSGKTNFEGTIMQLKDGNWTHFEEDSIQAKTGVIYRNITSVTQDPNDPNHHFASSATGGLYEFRNGRFVNLYNNDNSPIASIMPTSPSYKIYNRLTGAQYDSKGNLWFFNNQVDTIIHVRTPQGKWQQFYYERIKDYPTFDNYVFDRRGWVWMSHRRWAGTFNAGIACLNYNGTLDKRSDDKFTFCTTFTNQNGTTASISLLYTIVMDRDDQLWIGTDQGVFVLRDPTTIFSSNVVFHQPTIPRNDGTNYADYLLDGVPVRAIAVDGANRKWIGTTNSGVYLVSADGLEIIEHFTTDNSPLLSNSILSLAINPQNGLVMIGTDKGLMSYKGDATEPATTLKESNIKVFPNPVRPNYTGKIKVTGFTTDSDVKITSTSGIVVAQGKSLGGTFVWDGRDNQGDRVATGVYYVIGSDSEGKNGVVAKILMVK